MTPQKMDWVGLFLEKAYHLRINIMTHFHKVDKDDF